MGQKWFYSEKGRETGPFSFDQLEWLVANKRLSPDELVWSEGMPNCSRAAEVVGLFSTDQAIRIKPPPLPKSGWKATETWHVGGRNTSDGSRSHPSRTRAAHQPPATDAGSGWRGS